MQLEYDFQWYTVDVLTDVPVLALSEARSLLPADVTLPLRQTRTAAWAPPPHDELTALRRYLGLARQLEHTIEQATTKVSTAITGGLLQCKRGMGHPRRAVLKACSLPPALRQLG